MHELDGCRPLADQRQKLVSSFFVVPERSEHGARYGSGMLLLDTPHHHAEMPGFANHAYADGVYQFLDGLSNLLRKTFLDLKASRECVYQPRDLAESDNLLIRQISDVHLPKKGQQMMFA